MKTRYSFAWLGVFLATSLLGCEIGGSVSNEDSDPNDSDTTIPSSDSDTSVLGTDSDSTTLPQYNGIPGAEPGACGYGYVPVNIHAVADSDAGEAGIRFTYDELGNVATLESDVQFSPRTTFTYDDYLLVGTVHERFESDGGRFYQAVSTFEYNEQTLPTRWEQVITMGTAGNEELLYRVKTFTYDNDKLAELTSSNCADTGDTACTDLAETTTYTYDVGGRLTGVAMSDGNSIFEYDTDNRIVAANAEDIDGNTVSTSTFTYESERLLTKTRNDILRIYYYSDERLDYSVYEGTPSSTTTFTYSDESDACAVLRAWTIPFEEPYENNTSQLMMMDTYGEPSSTELFF